MGKVSSDLFGGSEIILTTSHQKRLIQSHLAVGLFIFPWLQLALLNILTFWNSPQLIRTGSPCVGVIIPFSLDFGTSFLSSSLVVRNFWLHGAVAANEEKQDLLTIN